MNYYPLFIAISILMVVDMALPVSTVDFLGDVAVVCLALIALVERGKHS